MSSSEAVYLDHAATTPVLPAVLAAMTGQLGRVGNASSLHASGRAARRVAEQSRERLAEALLQSVEADDYVVAFDIIGWQLVPQDGHAERWPLVGRAPLTPSWALSLAEQERIVRRDMVAVGATNCSAGAAS